MIKSALRMLAATFFWTLFICALWVLTLRVLPPPVTWIMAQQHSELGHIDRQWVPLDHMASTMPLAIIAAEDQKFFDHTGFDWQAMQRAMNYNDRKQGKRVKGASTISQQTAKNVFCWPGRTFIRKGIEAWFTLLIEALWSKERILEMYLNVAETGKGRFGVEATAQACFRSSAAQLSPARSALVAAVLPSPRRFNACAPSGYVQRRARWIQGQMNNLGDLMDPQERQRMREEEDRKMERASKRRHRS
jgi:monofunctional biosynthetic peptidoglycan transglycosylase